MKKSIRIISCVFLFVAFILFIIAIFILFLGNDKENSKLVKDNYYVDDNNVKINNSELISEKHFPKKNIYIFHIINIYNKIKLNQFILPLS